MLSVDKRTSSRIKTLLLVTEQLTLTSLSTGEPTYWSTAHEEATDLLNFALIRGLNKSQIKLSSSPDLNSDHSPVMIDNFQIFALKYDIVTL